MNQTQQTGNQGQTGGMSAGATQAERTGNGKTQPWGGASAQEHSEGMVAKTIEQQTAKLPSDLFLWGAVGGMAVSAALELTGHKDKSRFFGQWVAPLLLFGVYNKLVKVAGSDKTEAQGQ